MGAGLFSHIEPQQAAAPEVNVLDAAALEQARADSAMEALFGSREALGC